MAKQREATTAAVSAAIAAAGVSAEVERYEELASERRRTRARLWSEAQAGGMSYARLGDLANIHPSKVHEAVVEHRRANRRAS